MTDTTAPTAPNSWERNVHQARDLIADIVRLCSDSTWDTDTTTVVLVAARARRARKLLGGTP